LLSAGFYHAAFFQPNSPIYSAKAVRFRMGRRISPDDGEGDVTGEGLPPTEGQFVWTYTSPEFPMLQVNSTFNLPMETELLLIMYFRRLLMYHSS